jgi:hypothetical protein
MSPSKTHMGDIVMMLQQKKFSSPLWKLPKVVAGANYPIQTRYWVDATLNRTHDGHPLSVVLKVEETNGSMRNAYEMSWYLSDVSLWEVANAIKLVFPEFTVPDDWGVVCPAI